MKMLIVEDSKEIVETLSILIKFRWPDAEIITTPEGKKGVEVLMTTLVDIVILDINLPDIDGFHVLRILREFSKIPVIMLTVKGAEEDRVRGLEGGADDYVVKPFRSKELLARIEAVLRRSSVTTEQVFDIYEVAAKLRITPVMVGRLLYKKQMVMRQYEGKYGIKESDFNEFMSHNKKLI